MSFSLRLLSISVLLLIIFTLSAAADSGAVGNQTASRRRKESDSTPKSTATHPPLCSKNIHSQDFKTIGGPLLPMACNTGPKAPRHIAKLDCMKALIKFHIVDNRHPNDQYPRAMTQTHGSCSLTLKSNWMLNAGPIRDALSQSGGVGIEAMIDSCCPHGFDWRIDHLMDQDVWVRVIVDAASPKLDQPRSAKASKP